jgi:integrase
MIAKGATGQVGAYKSLLSAPNKRRTNGLAIVLPWPDLLPETDVSQFPQAEQLPLFSEAGEIDVAALRRKEAERRAQQCAGATRRAYESDWKNFRTFCAKVNRDSLPAMPGTVTLYLDYAASRGLAVATITRRLAAITTEHKRAGHPTPCKSEDVHIVLADIRHELGVAQKPKTPVSPEDLEAMLDQTGEGIIGLRDRALLLTGFGSWMRRSELAALNLADATFERLGLLIRIGRSKTDQDGKGQEVGVHRCPRKAVCPVRALEKWIAARGKWAGPLFPHVLRSGKVTRERLAPRAIARVVKRTAKRAGLDPAKYSGHSLRSGGATAAAAAGADILAIKNQLRHASMRTTEKYIRHGSVFAVNPLKGVM